MKVLVTGAGGCIGAWALKRLLDSGDRPVAFDLSEDRSRLALLDDQRADSVPWETGDIADDRRVTEVCRAHQPDAVIHLAALQVPFCRDDPAAGARVNVVGTVNVFQAARACGIRRVVYASSVASPAMDQDARWLKPFTAPINCAASKSPGCIGATGKSPAWAFAPASSTAPRATGA